MVNITRKAVLAMLNYWRSHSDYQEFVRSQFRPIALLANPLPDPQVLEYADIISKLYILDTDRLKYVLAHCYSYTGRPAEQQPEIFRTYILMQHLHIPVSDWIHKLNCNFVLRTACGLREGEVPSIASFYSFIERIDGPKVQPRIKKFLSKPRKKLKKGEKLPPKHPGITSKLKDQIMKGRRFNNPTDDILNEILSIPVRKSLEFGLFNNHVNVNGDGTCVHTGASHYGMKICECQSKGIYDCDCPRRFSDPSATWGWDSHNEKYYYGYTGYFLSTYNKANKVDLPLYIRTVEAKRHDSVSAIVALPGFRDLYPELTIDSFISDSASDNYATYELLEHWDINAIIALNKTALGNSKYPVPIKHEGGVPICPASYKMVNWGSNKKDRSRNKWRCPRACKKGENKPERCSECDSCSPSPYGRVVYTKLEWDPRLFCRVPRSSVQWKELMKERSAAERVNNRILNNYQVEKMPRRGKKRISFFIMIAAINIHLDAQLKKLSADGSFDLFRDVI